MTESHQPIAPVAGRSPISSDQASSARSSQHDNDSTAKSSGSGGDPATSTRMLSELKDKIAGAREVVKTKYRVASESTDDYVHEAPWKAVTMALIGGFIIGMLARR
ncbi:hypothetical protein LMG28614_04160 [Paraburkholderia ultramafica]|uniref:DUF883 domain-containing protein n=1 Tax=Paraburkholderia ultramafica TaxID=1544867 RepID=A0A6S7BD41_9BURK|nr:DUF883 family protein [Paraburkholderia ultramafica]CAB3795363.1 hypothetical protein LMG28614_04160 [Paraburkholderia ultramafica]